MLFSSEATVSAALIVQLGSGVPDKPGAPSQLWDASCWALIWDWSSLCGGTAVWSGFAWQNSRRWGVKRSGPHSQLLSQPLFPAVPQLPSWMHIMSLIPCTALGALITISFGSRVLQQGERAWRVHLQGNWCLTGCWTPKYSPMNAFIEPSALLEAANIPRDRLTQNGEKERRKERGTTF